jgi:glycosyltransferase involved in cell wall biosynthesis
MPAYNAALYLREAVDSVLKQTCTDFELIVVDDASTDETATILASYDDPRIRVHRFASNGGVSRARNMGLEMARGEYVALQDADDLSYPERLEKQILYLDSHPQVAAVGSQSCRAHRRDWACLFPGIRRQAKHA